MPLQYTLVEDNSLAIAETAIIIPIKWRVNQVQTVVLKTPLQLSLNINITKDYIPRTTVTQGVWATGGTGTISTQVCRYENGNINFGPRWSFSSMPAPAGWPNPWLHFSGEQRIHITNITPEIDWEAAMATLRLAANPLLFKIGAARFCDVSGNNTEDVVKDGLITLDSLNQYYSNLDNVGNIVSDDLFDFKFETTDEVKIWEMGGDIGDILNVYTDEWTVGGVTNDEDGNAFNDTVHDMDINTCQTNSRTLPMYLKVWMATTAVGSGSGSLQEPDDAQVKEEDEEDPSGWSSLGGTSGSTGAGSSAQGLNSISSLYGNSELPFDSIYLTGANYNSLVSAGGGIVSNSGVFPLSDSIYIDTIRLGVEGSTMTVVEVVDYDATPSLNVSDKIYGYLLNATNKTKPVFAGFVISQQRRCSGSTREIVYECRDLSYFFGQLYSPSHYIYRPPSLDGSGTVKTYDRVLKEVLNVAGVPTSIISIPTYTAPPVNWIYQSLKSVLEWAAKYFGKYVYYIDRYGMLNFRATDSLTNVKTYTIGDKSGEISVEEFSPITDFSRSRSRIVLTGDYEITEHELQANYSGNTVLDPNDNDNQTGIFHFNQTIDGVTYTFYYFMLKPGSTLNDKLLSDPSKSALITLMKQTSVQTNTINGVVTSDESKIDEPKDLSIKVFKSQPGDSEVYVEDSVLNFTGVQVIRARYATRTDSPIQVYTDTGRFGGTEVVRRPEFKKLTSSDNKIDDTPLMNQYLNSIKDFYKPVYGGKLTLDGLDTDIYLLAKVSIAGSSLSSTETNNLICYSIEYNVKDKRTTVDLSNRVFNNLPFFDSTRERSRENNEILAKMGLLEETELYKRL